MKERGSVKGLKCVAVERVCNTLSSVWAIDIYPRVPANTERENALPGRRHGGPIPVGYAKSRGGGSVSVSRGA